MGGPLIRICSEGEIMQKARSLFWLFFAIPLAALAQKAVTQGDAIETTAEIVAIDKDARVVTLKDEDGEFEEVFCGPEVKRFDELKVGDKVTFRYYESVVSQIRKPGDPKPPVSSPTLVRGTGSKPSGTLSEQMSATVTVTEIDAEVPSVTIKTEDGRTMSFKVADRKNLEGVKVGDKVDITYTAALMITVK
jgi:Cu/Ag efflux protein CusF